MEKCNKNYKKIIFSKEITTKLRQLVTCVVCYEVSRTNIGFCPKEHHICEGCWERLPPIRGSRRKTCPYCRTELTVLRPIRFVNLALPTISVPCRHDIFGCPISLKIGNEIDAHEARCQYRPVKCPMCRLDCEWSGPANEVVAHIYNAHPDVYFINASPPKVRQTCRVSLKVAETPIDWHLAFILGDQVIFVHAFLTGTIFEIRFQSHFTTKKSDGMPTVKVRFGSFARPDHYLIFKPIIADIRDCSSNNAFPLPVGYLIDNFISDGHIVFEVKFN